jgi:hypothetical protein
MASQPPKPTPTAPQSSIPGYRPSAPLTAPKKFILAAIFFVPVASYLWLQRIENHSRTRARLLEEEGRKNWASMQADEQEREKQRWLANKGKDLSVRVGRSGGGVWFLSDEIQERGKSKEMELFDIMTCISRCRKVCIHQQQARAHAMSWVNGRYTNPYRGGIYKLRSLKWAKAIELFATTTSI